MPVVGSGSPAIVTSSDVIVPMAVRIIALAENAAVLFRREFRIVVEVRCREFDFARDAYHCVLCGSGLDAVG